jgi:anti-sigma regulatory factor (Ser/Thr protein kinase)
MLGKVTIGNALPQIAAVAAECHRVAHWVGVEADALADLQVALDEILSNAIRYAFPDGGSHPIVVCFSYDGTAIEITVEYGGVPFDPADAPPPDRDSPLSARRPGGLGVHFARELMDQLHYRRVGMTNCVTLVRKLSRKTGAGPDGSA